MVKDIEHIDISDIKDPAFVKNLDYKGLDVLCSDIREEIIKETSIYGGHLSSNLGVVELTVALHRSFDFPKDKLIFDVGHQCYAHKILTGRHLEHLNEKGFVSGYQKIGESEYDCYEAGHSSTSLSAAEAFAIARDQKKEKYDVVALIGDGSIVNGLSFEALNDIGSRNHKVIIVLNDNDMSISKPTGGLGRFFRSISTQKAYNKFKQGYKRVMLRTTLGKKLYSISYALKSSLKRRLVPITMFDNMGFTYMGPYDGHNIKVLERAFKKAKVATKSVVLHVYTTKGRGYTYAEKDTSGYWHGVTPFDIETGQPKNLHPGQISWSHYFSDLTNEIMAKFPETELIVPATLKGSGLEQAFRLFPNRCIDVGIAEEHAVTMAGALALNGLHPIVVIYSTFLQRAYDEISHDCARLNVNMTILVDRAGLVGSNGETHQGIYDEAFLKSIPGVVVTMPSDQSEAKALYHQSLDNHEVDVGEASDQNTFAFRKTHLASAHPIHRGHRSHGIDVEFTDNGILKRGPGGVINIRGSVERNLHDPDLRPRIVRGRDIKTARIAVTPQKRRQEQGFAGIDCSDDINIVPSSLRLNPGGNLFDVG